MGRDAIPKFDFYMLQHPFSLSKEKIIKMITSGP